MSVLNWILSHAVMTYGRADVQHHTFLTSVPDGGEWWASPPGKEPSVPIG